MKKIFSGNEDFNKSAFINWRTSKHEDINNILVLADGFLSSAIELSKNCLANNANKKADILIFPILFNANHGIELYLKALIWTLNKLLNSETKEKNSHNIKLIFNTVKLKIETLKGKDWAKDFNKQSEGLQEYIDEIYILTSDGSKKDNMDFPRYPIKTSYENHFYIDYLNNIEIDLENFVFRFEQIKTMLDERASYFFHVELMNNL
jgi:hypothetical protein